MTETPRGDVVVGRAGKPHGVKGEVVVHAGRDDESIFAPGQAFDTDRGTLTVARARRHHGTFLVLFDGVGSREGAEALRGLAMRVPPEHVTLGEEEWWAADLVGCRVVLSNGTEVGLVLDVVTGTAQDRLVIGTASSPSIEIPFVQALVPTVDAKARRIVITPPDGLIEATSAPE